MNQSKKIVIDSTAESTNQAICRPSNLHLPIASWYGAKKIVQETQQSFTLQNACTAVQLWTCCFKAKLDTVSSVLISLICYAHLYAFTYGILML